MKKNTHTHTHTHTQTQCRYKGMARKRVPINVTQWHARTLEIIPSNKKGRWGVGGISLI